jgi:hypothetical protein
LGARTSSHYYVYYRVSGNPAVARATVGALIADVETRTGVAGRLLARCDDPGTWMEVYEPVRNARSFARTLAACVRRIGAGEVAVDGVRTSECFTALAGGPARRVPRQG